MSKSMYSLILTDEVVRAVDKLAHQKGSNRSSLINQILAERLSLKTPEKRVEEVFLHMGRELDEQRFQAVQRSAGMFVVKGSVNFKYNPTIRYAIELEAMPKAYAGWLKISTRTQNRSLTTRLGMFYEMWMQIEQSCPPELRRSKPKFEMPGGSFSRDLIAEHRGEGFDPGVLGNALASYLNMFDKAMEMFFDTKTGMDIGTYKEILAMYGEFAENSVIIM